jgi:type I restriction enzyme S subunit
MNGLPEGWVEASLGECAAFNPRHDADVSHNTLVSFVPMPAVSDIEGEITSPTSRSFAEVATGYTHFREGDVIFAKITPCMENGKIAVARALENGIACGSTEFHVLRPQGGISPDYIWRYLRQQSFRDDAEASMTGAVGQRRVPTDYLKNSGIPLPPLPEQRRIVAKIDSLSGKSKRARDHLDHFPRLVEKYKQAVLAAAFRGELTREWRASPDDVETAQELVARTKEPDQSRGGREATTNVKSGVAGLSVNDPGIEPRKVGPG